MTLLTQRILIVFLLVFSSSAVFAKAKIPLGKREVLKKVADLPDTEEFKLRNGQFLDLATLHQEFNIAYFLPLYVTDEPRLVGFDEKSETYYDLPQNELDSILAAQKLNKDDLNKLPFYTRYGGKLVALLIIGLIVYGMLPSKKEKVEPTTV